MSVCISIHADTDTLCFRPIILKRVNSPELVVQKIVYFGQRETNSTGISSEQV